MMPWVAVTGSNTGKRKYVALLLLVIAEQQSTDGIDTDRPDLQELLVVEAREIEVSAGLVRKLSAHVEDRALADLV